VSFKGKIMSRDKYLMMFSWQMEATCIAFIICQIFFAKCTLLKRLSIGNSL